MNENQALQNFLKDWKENNIPFDELNNLNEQRKKNGKWITWWDELYTAYRLNQDKASQEQKSMSAKIAGIGTAWAIWASYWLWSILKKIGKTAYWYAFKENPAAASAIIRWDNDVQWIRKTAIETKWLYWNETSVWQKAYKEQQRIWNKDIAPNINTDEIVTTVDDLKSQVVNNINNSKFSSAKKNSLIQEADDWANTLMKDYPDGISQWEAQKLTSEMWAQLSSVYKKSGSAMSAVPATDEFKWMLMEGRSVLRNMQYQSMANQIQWGWSIFVSSKQNNQKLSGIKNAFKKYGNLGNIVEMAEKDLQARSLGGALWAQSAVIKWVGMPVVTAWGKALYNIWKVLKKPWDILINAVKTIGKWPALAKSILEPVSLIAPDFWDTKKRLTEKMVASWTLPKDTKIPERTPNLLELAIDKWPWLLSKGINFVKWLFK